MGKYSPEQLEAMATIFMTAWQARDERALQLVFTIQAITGLEPGDVVLRIQELANVPSYGS